MNKTRKIILFILALIFLASGIFAVMINSGMNNIKQKNSSEMTGYVPGPLEEDHISENLNANIFNIKKIKSNKKSVTVQVVLEGEVSLCRYSMSVLYDPNALKLVGYDEDLSVFSPVVYPGKDKNGKIEQIPESGRINLSWASAKNITKKGEIINITFEKTKEFSDNAFISCRIKGVNKLNDGVIEEAEYNTKSLEIS